MLNKEQLKAIFIKKLTEVYDYEIEHLQPEKESYILKTANELLYEVTLRNKLK